MPARAAPSIASPTAEFACPSFKARTVHRKKGYFAALIAKLLTLPNDTRAGLNAGARCAHKQDHPKSSSSPWARSRHQAIRTLAPS